MTLGYISIWNITWHKLCHATYYYIFDKARTVQFSQGYIYTEKRQEVIEYYTRILNQHPIWMVQPTPVRGMKTVAFIIVMKILNSVHKSLFTPLNNNTEYYWNPEVLSNHFESWNCYCKYVFWKSFANETQGEKIWLQQSLLLRKKSSNLCNEAEKALLCLVIGAVRYPDKK